MTPNSPALNGNGLLARLSEADRERLGEGLRRLMANGSILGTEPGQTELSSTANLAVYLGEVMRRNMTNFDYLIILFYLAFILSVGLVLRRLPDGATHLRSHG